MSRNEQKTSKDREHSKRGFWIAGILVILILSGVIVILTQFNIETIQVTGNVHYTEEEIIQRVVGDEHWNNTLLLYLKNKIKPPEAIPFVQKVDVEFISRHVITITVYEKALAGCVEFMNEYMYFDKDGMVLESSSERMDDIPCITGIRFDRMIMYEPLPIEDKDFFHTVLTLTQLLQKYQIPATYNAVPIFVLTDFSARSFTRFRPSKVRHTNAITAKTAPIPNTTFIP